MSRYVSTMRTKTSTAIAVIALLPLAAGAAAPDAPEPPAELPERAAVPDRTDLPERDDIDEYTSFDAGPELQTTPGGGLIVNAFIMEGPVRVVISDRDSGDVVLEQREDSLFPFEVPRSELGISPQRARVDIYIGEELAHQLELER